MADALRATSRRGNLLAMIFSPDECRREGGIDQDLCVRDHGQHVTHRVWICLGAHPTHAGGMRSKKKDSRVTPFDRTNSSVRWRARGRMAPRLVAGSAMDRATVGDE